MTDNTTPNGESLPGNDSTPAAPATTTTPPAAVLAQKPKPGLAVAALVVGIVAFVSAVIPFLSFVAFVPALTAVGLGIAALVKRAGKGKSLTGLVLGAVAFFLAIGVSTATVGAISGAGSSVGVDSSLSAAAPSSTPSDPASEAPPVEPSAEPTPEAPVVPENMVYSGSGDSVVSIELPDGADQIAIATISHSGSRNFTVWALDSGMNEQDLMVNQIGNYSGTVAFNLRGNDTTALEVNADGKWTITLRSVLTLKEFSGSEVSGAGDDVLIYRGDAGVATIAHNGSRNFTIWTYGDRSDLVVNEIGAYNGSVRWSAGPSLVVISADGKWSVAVG